MYYLCSPTFCFGNNRAKIIPAEEVNLFFLLETIIGPIWVWLVVKEQPTLETIIGGAVIIITLGIHSFIKLREPEKIIN